MMASLVSHTSRSCDLGICPPLEVCSLRLTLSVVLLECTPHEIGPAWGIHFICFHLVQLAPLHFCLERLHRDNANKSHAAHSRFIVFRWRRYRWDLGRLKYFDASLCRLVPSAKPSRPRELSDRIWQSAVFWCAGWGSDV